MKGITWARDSHGLFDYESSHLSKKTMKASAPTTIIRKGNDIDLVPNLGGNLSQTNDQKPLLNIINENGKSNSVFRGFSSTHDSKGFCTVTHITLIWR